MDNFTLNTEASRVYDAISRVSRQAYKDPYLVANRILSKNRAEKDLLDAIAFGNESLPFRILCSKIAFYYIKSLLHYMRYLIRFCEYRISSLRFGIDRLKDELILIDVYFFVEKIRDSKNFQDIFFTGLEEVMKKKGKHYAYLPYFYDPSYNKQPARFLRILDILRKEDVPVLSEYQLLGLSDIFRLFWFIMAYPFHLLNFQRRLETPDRETRAFKYELLDTIDDVAFYNFARYLVGKRVSALPYPGIKVISWYENQAINKSFYMGLRSGGSKSRIYGAQILMYSDTHLNLIPDESEKEFGVIPDEIVVNGPYYLRRTNSLKYRIGPSLRYTRLFAAAYSDHRYKDVVVLLPYTDDDARNILKMLAAATITSGRVLIKVHPAMRTESLKRLIPPGAVISDRDMYELFETAGVVIGAASGALVAATTLGIPALVVRTPGRSDQKDFFPLYGKGIVWDEVSDAKEIDNQIARFKEIVATRPQEVRDVADTYKKTLFCDPTEDNIVKAFDL
ncbi:MAG: hypothetical protein PHX20_02110 [Candidatus Omnitrophica bacterium]|nr:hypothetical protein [Candidatus Omnitrophota bacterium]MDD5436316.1 hypothetical protein [Candidatus Omnitrophota bacterium]